MRAVYRTVALVFSLVCYGSFLLVFLYLLAFLANLQATSLADAFPMLKALSRSIDLGRDMGSPQLAVLVDVGLILLFGLQHSVMARPGFKRVWTRVVPKELERSAYVLLSSFVLALVMWQWRPIPMPVLWHAEAAWSIALAWSVMGVGVLVLLWATFLIDHFELFGLRQTWSMLLGKELRGPSFVTPYLYKLMRHPLYLGWLLIFWGTPTMTVGHLLFSTGMSLYIFVGMHYEERDLVKEIGDRYERYRQEVPALLPLPGRRFSA